ncbi:MAG: hypothetical protein KAQ98_11200 [Bacteriovoracaceae bacterium]|nr:hypothetical protein [Bacteriovoracaceae bacterium]
MKTLHLIFLTMVLVLAVGCGGKKSNTVGVGAYADAYGSFGRNSNPQIQAQVNEAYNQYPCSGHRIELNLHTQNAYSTSTVVGPFQQGSSGVNEQAYIGYFCFESNKCDILLVGKVMNGYTVTGYNVTVAYCVGGTSTTPNINYTLSNFQTSGIMLMDNTLYETGGALSNYTEVQACAAGGDCRIFQDAFNPANY